jgi:hypothetical protein
MLRRDMFSLNEAKEWILSHGYALKKIDITPGYFRFRQVEPAHLQALGMKARTQALGKVGFLVLFYQ